MSSFKRKYLQWRALDSWERGLLIKLSLVLPLAWVAFKLVGFNRVRSIAEFELPDSPNAMEQFSIERAQRYAQLTSIAAHHGIYKANCLHQSLTLCWVLRKQGLPAQIRIGVRPNTQPFEAHAWVELNGIPLGQSVDAFKAFDRLTADPDKTKFI